VYAQNDIVGSHSLTNQISSSTSRYLLFWSNPRFPLEKSKGATRTLKQKPFD